MDEKHEALLNLLRQAGKEGAIVAGITNGVILRAMAKEGKVRCVGMVSELVMGKIERLPVWRVACSGWDAADKALAEGGAS